MPRRVFESNLEGENKNHYTQDQPHSFGGTYRANEPPYVGHHWKKPDKKRRSLISLGVEAGMAYAWSRTRMGGWRVAQSPILRTTITVERLDKRGYMNLLDYYHQRKSH